MRHIASLASLPRHGWRGVSEPGLILTPLAIASEDDNGYLSAGEVAEPKLHADWVLLSAGSTAAGDADGARALSGLARALLVSHWTVDSNAAMKLITTAMHETARDSKVGRAEALRRSMPVLIDKGDAGSASDQLGAVHCGRRRSTVIMKCRKMAR